MNVAHYRILLLLLAAHAVAAVLLVPAHHGVAWFYQGGFSKLWTELLADAVALATSGITHGIALAQLWLLGMWAALSCARWTFRLVVTAGLWVLLLICWSLVPFILGPGDFDPYFSELTVSGPKDAAVLSLGYLFIIAAAGWLARRFGSWQYTLRDCHLPDASVRWQIGIRDLLIATLIVGLALAVLRWNGSFWVKAILNVVNFDEIAVAFATTHAIIATPLIALLAYRTATREPSAPRARGRLPLYIGICALETITLMGYARLQSGWSWRNPFDVSGLGYLAIFVLCVNGSQLIVTAVTVRCLRAAGGRLWRTNSRAGSTTNVSSINIS